MLYGNGKVHWGEDVGGQNLGGTYFGTVGAYQVVPDPQCASGGVLDHTDAMGFNIRTGIQCPLMAIADSSGRILLQNPLPGTRGTLGQRTITGPGTWTLDGSLSKSFQISETMRTSAQSPRREIRLGTFRHAAFSVLIQFGSRPWPMKRASFNAMYIALLYEGRHFLYNGR